MNGLGLLLVLVGLVLVDMNGIGLVLLVVMVVLLLLVDMNGLGLDLEEAECSWLLPGGGSTLSCSRGRCEDPSTAQTNPTGTKTFLSDLETRCLALDSVLGSVM